MSTELKYSAYPCMPKSVSPVHFRVIRMCCNRHTCAFGNAPEKLEIHFQLLTESLIAAPDVFIPHAIAQQLKKKHLHTYKFWILAHLYFKSSNPTGALQETPCLKYIFRTLGTRTQERQIQEWEACAWKENRKKWKGGKACGKNLCELPLRNSSAARETLLFQAASCLSWHPDTNGAHGSQLNEEQHQQSHQHKEVSGNTCYLINWVITWLEMDSTILLFVKHFAISPHDVRVFYYQENKNVGV